MDKSDFPDDILRTPGTPFPHTPRNRKRSRSIGVSHDGELDDVSPSRHITPHARHARKMLTTPRRRVSRFKSNDLFHDLLTLSKVLVSKEEDMENQERNAISRSENEKISIDQAGSPLHEHSLLIDVETGLEQTEMVATRVGSIEERSPAHTNQTVVPLPVTPSRQLQTRSIEYSRESPGRNDNQVVPSEDEFQFRDSEVTSVISSTSRIRTSEQHEPDITSRYSDPVVFETDGSTTMNTAVWNEEQNHSIHYDDEGRVSPLADDTEIPAYVTRSNQMPVGDHEDGIIRRDSQEFPSIETALEVTRQQRPLNVGNDSTILALPGLKPAARSLGRRSNRPTRNKQKDDVVETAIPERVVKDIIRMVSGAKLLPDAFNEVLNISNTFFEQVMDDLTKYVDEDNRQTIECQDVLKLLRQQRLTGANRSPFALAHKYLPAELLNGIFNETN